SAPRYDAHDLRDRVLGATATAIFVAEVLPRLREVEGLRITENATAPDYRAATSAPVVSVDGQARDNDWLDLHVTVTIDGEAVDFAELFTALARDEPILVLPSGTYFPLDDPELQRLREIIAEASALSDRPIDSPAISRYQLDLWDELGELGIVTAHEAQWWLKVQSLSASASLAPVEPPPTLRAQLRDYQVAGLSWLEFLRTNGLGGVLADDMGLGKTVQTIAMMERARLEDAELAPFLVVAPTSVVGNWAAECARFAPDLVVRTVEATEKRRGTSLADHVAGAHVVVTSYALFRIEAEQYRGIGWSGLILDEAQQIKNAASQGYRAARSLDVPFTLAVTGTPLENNLLEFWALVSLACPGLLGARTHFTEFYRTPIEREGDAERLATLQRRVRPFLLRRTKDLVAAELPAKQEQVLELDLHPAHRKLYDRRLQRERQKLLGLVDDMAGNGFQIFRTLTLLRQLALDPALVDEGEAPSAKLEALVELLTEADAEGHRVLVVSQFTRFLSRAREAVTAAGLDYAYLDGSTTNRQRVIDDFRSGTAPVFLVSLKAGGFGLNLVEADYVVLLDPWWNPAVEAQAIDRTHRLGQTRPVVVYRMVARGTIEQKVMELKAVKSQLFSRVLDEGGAFEPGTLTADDIRGLVE
ncbi:DEAD/DEAH box helicase, partial [Microbacterium sp.]|uniref:DEAD/DEAH box helicase n=1 Tax=Microbacterium sp. TaxID=51671 RepID=UPI003C7100C1